MRYLLVGGTGLLGATLSLSLRDNDDEVVLAARRPPEGWESVEVDVSATGAIERLAPEVDRADVIINAVAVTHVDRCETDPLAERVNVEWPAILAERAARSGRRLVHISTDAVYDLDSGSASESEPPRPANAYARQKLAAEQAVVGARALVARTNFFGWSPRPQQGLAEWILAELRSGRSISGFEDVYFSPLYVGHLAERLVALDRAGAVGVVNVGARGGLSKYEFARALALRFGLDDSCVAAGQLADAGLKAERSRRTCMNSARSSALVGAPPPTVGDGIDAMFRGQAALKPRLMAEFSRKDEE